MEDWHWRFRAASLVWAGTFVLLLVGGAGATTTGTTPPINLDSAITDTARTTAADSAAVPSVAGDEPEDNFALIILGVGGILIVLAAVVLIRLRGRSIDVEAYLLVRSGDRVGSRYRVVRARTKIGSQQDNDLVLTDDHISRHHLLLTYERGAFVAVDLNSLYGTYFDGKRIEREELAPGKKINLGGAVDLELSIHV